MFNKLLIGLLGTVVCTTACSEQGALEPEEVILKRLQEARPDIPYGEVKPSPIEGLYQVHIADGQVIYVTPDGDKMIVGDLFAIGPGGFSTLEDPELVQMRREVLQKLDADEAISFKPSGETKAVVYVFTDVDCGFCRELHNQLNEYRDERGVTRPGYSDLGIEIRYLAYPRGGIPSRGASKLISAWCADDRQETLHRLKNLQAVAPKSCENNPVAKHFELGGSIGVRGTPALLLSDGRMIVGYQPPEQLARTLGL